MKTFWLLILLAASLAGSARAATDSVVTFNEVMYHPLTNEPAMEWVELYNQMTVDVDISNWRLGGGIDFHFPIGTVIRGRGYLVVASDPASLQAALGLTGVLGPFSNRLSNAGETLTLKNNSDRLMDSLSYLAEFDWPVAADGAGPSLAKKSPTQPSGNPASWTASTEIGGTPGARNFIPAGTFSAPPGLVSFWNFNETNTAINDLVGGNHGVPGSGVSRVAGLAGQGAFAFNSSTNAFINVGSGVGNNFSVTDGITIEALLRPGWSGSSNATIFRKEEPVLGALVSYWSFDESNSGTTPALDPISGNNGTFLGSASRTNGLAGLGAARFGNAATDGISVGAGLNNSFSMSTGITVFARIRPTWSGASGDYDEIFRKEDGGSRILLSFQNDANNGSANPPVSGGPVLSFGLNVGGVYGELDMPLDGLAGRPTLAQLKDGATHSVAATYDSATGLKGIWIDGTLRWSVTLSGAITSGGAAAAVIGNGFTSGGEAFTGTIDEVAIWRAALTGAQIASLNGGASPAAIGASGNPTASTRVLLAFQNDGNNANANPPVPAGPVLSFGLNVGGNYNELDMPLDGSVGRPTLAQLEDGAAHHVAATYDRTSGLKGLYVDGVLRFSTTLAGPITSGGAAPALIGNSGAPGTESFNGTLDEVAFWNRALTAVEVARHAASTQAGQDYFANAASTNRTLLSFDSAWRYEQSGADLGTAWRAVDYNDAAWPNGPGLLAYETCNCLPDLIRTTLTTNEFKTTFYFRTHFNYTGNVAQAQLALRHVIDDGAIVYLNGVEVWRIGMPAGPATYSTLANRGVDNATLEGPFSIPATNLVLGDNVLAVEVHQTATTSSDIVFGLALDSVETIYVPGGGLTTLTENTRLAFNEVAASTNPAFWLELVNYGATDLNLAGFRIVALGATNRTYLFPSQTLAAGAYLQVTASTLGFGVTSGDKLVLYAPNGGTVLDAVVAKKDLRGRNPDATGAWQFPSAPTPGAPNAFIRHDEIVINEIMYSHRSIPASPAVYGQTNLLLNFTNVWRYQALGVDLGTAWRDSAYDDSAWPAGPALLYNTPSTFPVPKNTLMSATNAAGQRVITYYFRTEFDWNGGSQQPVLSLRDIVDDGAIFYLNGVEVFRQNMPSGTVNYSTVAAVAVGVATFTGPFSLPATSLLPGRNVLAVEVHRISTVDSDVVFGAELSAAAQLSPAVPAQESPESWLELFNRSSNPVDLTGWRLDEGIDYRFSPGKIIAPGGYLVVAKDPAYMLGLYPGLDVVGPFTNKLSKSSDLVVLKDPNNNPANTVLYYGSGRWPEAAHGGGSSLELRDPLADNSKAESWAASVESGKSAWTNISYRLVASTTSGQPSQWNEFVLGLLDNGECLIDDISVIESPTNSPRQLIQNGSFETGRSGWRFLGTHALSDVIVDPDSPGNHVLHLVATGSMEHMHNHLETTLVNNHVITNGLIYDISFRARWLSGDNQLNSRLYFNRAARTSFLPVPALNGTPGARNSTFATNTGPTFANLRHSRVVPLAGEPVTVAVEAGDPQGVASCEVFWSANGSAWQSASMNLDLAQAVDTSARIPHRTFSGNIPGYPAGTVVQFYVRAVDGLGAAAAFPAAGPNSRALYQVNDGQAILGLAHNVRIIMTPGDNALLHALTNVMSNDLIGSTVVSDEERAYYDVGIRLKGSERGRDQPQRESYHLQFNPEDLFRGVHPVMLVDRSGGWRYGTTFGQEEIIINHLINRAGNIPGVYYDLIRVIAPQSAQTGPALFFPRLEDTFLDGQYKNGGDGNLYEFELIYYPLTTSDGTPQGYKLPEPDNVIAVDISDLGNDKEQYRYNFIPKINRARDDFSGLMAFAKSFSLTGSALDAATQQTMDVDQWMRAFAMMSLCGVGDAYTQGNNHNVRLFVRPEDQKAIVFPSDWDFSFVQAVTAPLHGDQNLAKVIELPANKRLFFCHLLDLISSVYTADYMNYWISHYNQFVPGQNFSAPGSGGQPPILSFISQRASYVLSQVPTNVAFAITNNGGADFSTTNSVINLSGTAPINVKFIEVNGIRYPVTWTSLTNWAISIPLYAGVNSITIQGVDNSGVKSPTLKDSITLTNTGVGALLPVVINEWMADNRAPGGLPDPADGLFQDWFELYNPNSSPVNLSGMFLTDTLGTPAKWPIPNNVYISGNGHLLVWADNNIEQNPAGGGTNVDLHANFQLNNAGEAIALFNAARILQHAVVFGPQIQNVSQGFFPDGNTNTVYSMTNWTPRAANTLSGLSQPLVRNSTISGGSITFQCDATPGRTYQLQYKDDLSAPGWTVVSTSAATRAAGSTITLSDTVRADIPSRFYRVVLLP